jgi:hypothetical protein
MDSIVSGLFPIAIAVFGIIICIVIGKTLFPKGGSDKSRPGDR